MTDTTINLLEDLNSLRLSHYECEDCYYSCPLSERYCGNSWSKECDCGATDHNATLDRVIEHLRSLGAFD